MYGYKRQVVGPFDTAVQTAKSRLKEEGFGILTEIDVKATLKEKLNVEYQNYLILGACNPPFAHQALQAEREIGLLMPCNVVVFEDNSEVFVSAILPTVAMSVVGDNPNLRSVAEQVEQKLRKALDSM